MTIRNVDYAATILCERMLRVLIDWTYGDGVANPGIKMNLDVIRGNADSAFTSAVRVLLGLFVLLTGVLTFFVPEFRGLFIGQLAAADIPLARLSLFVIPALEATAGVMLIRGFVIKPASLVTLVIMALITYLHLVVDDPTLFPLQFGLPLIPATALVLSLFLYFVEPGVDEG